MLQYKNIKFSIPVLLLVLFTALIASLWVFFYSPVSVRADHITSSSELDACYEEANSAAQQEDCRTHYNQYLEDNRDSGTTYKTCRDTDTGDGVIIPEDEPCPEGSEEYHGPTGNCEEDEVEIGVAVPGSEDRCIEKGDANNNPIFVYLRGIIQFLATGVGIIVTINLVIGGIQYMASRGNPQATQAALSRITNSVIALVLFILMAAILNFLVPGGLL